MAAIDDFFGTMMLGVDPYAEVKKAWQEQMSQVQSSFSDEINPAKAQENQNLSDDAKSTMTEGTGGDYNPKSVFSGQEGTPNLPGGVWTPPASESPGGINSNVGWIGEFGNTDPGDPGYGSGGPMATANPGEPYPGNPGGAGPYPGYGNSDVGTGSGSLYTNATIPSDLIGLRSALSQWLSGNFAQGGAHYGGQLTAPTPQGLSEGFNAFLQGQNQGGGKLNESWGVLSGLLNQFGGMQQQTQPWLNQAWNTAGQAGDVSQSWLAPMKSNLFSLAGNGGGPDITQALSDIRTKGMTDINQSLAQIKEQYANQGLSAGSDVSGALAQGAASGIAGINQQQSSLAAQVMSDAANRRLGALQAVPGFAGAETGAASSQANSQNSIIGTLLQSLLGPASLQAGVAGQLPGIGSSLGQLFNQSGAGLTAQGQGVAGIDFQNIQNLMQNFTRETTPQNLNTAVSYATGYPPQQPIVQGGGGGGWGAVGSIAGAMLPWLITLSSRDFKENITPLDVKAVAKKAKKIPLFNWSYKGDATRHMGPMAQDFQKTFGVGDGVTLHPLDMFGVILASMQGGKNA